MSTPIKQEFKTEEKVGGILDSKESRFATQGAEALHEEGTLYICANCTAQLYLKSDSQLLCPNCTHLTGASTVFYKVRTEPTTYDTI